MSKIIRKAYSYDDVMLVPQHNEIKSRWDTDLSVEMGNGLSLKCPIFSSPMDTVSGKEMAVALPQLGGACVIHRYNSIEDQFSLLKNAIDNLWEGNLSQVGIAIGNSRDFLERVQHLISDPEYQPGFINIDVAHGDSQATFEAVKRVRECWSGHLMVGNVCTFEAAGQLASLGVDSIRVGVGSGSACSTRVVCGHGVPMITALMDCRDGIENSLNTKVKIIADGGIKNSGDAIKALAIGADAVMLGSVLSGTDKTPGEKIEVEGSFYKRYRGMASKEALTSYKGEQSKFSSFEGISTLVPYKGSLEQVIGEFLTGIRSGLTYSGCKTILEFQAKAKFVEITSNGMQLSHPHYPEISST